MTAHPLHTQNASPPGRARVYGAVYAELAGGFGIGVRTVSPQIPRGIGGAGREASPLNEAVEIARRKPFVILDGTFLRIDRVGMTRSAGLPFCPGENTTRGGVNVQVIADPGGRSF